MARSRVAVLALGFLTVLVARCHALSNEGAFVPPSMMDDQCSVAAPGQGCPLTTPDGLGEVPLYSGDFVLVEDDMRIPGRGFDFVFRRLHRNRQQLRQDGMCGIDRVNPPEAAGLWGFTHSYDIHLESGPDTDELILTSGDGRVASFGAYKWHCTFEQCQGWDPPEPGHPCQGTDGCTLPGWDGWNVSSRRTPS